MLETAAPALPLSAIVAVATVTALAYLLYRAKQGRLELTLIDVAILALLLTILFAAGKPLLDELDHHAKRSALESNLYLLRTQIELYRAEHQGQAPVVRDGTFPQLIRPTNEQGVPGPGGSRYPLGPYLRNGVPINPFTGRSVVTAVDDFPPEAPTGAGGWVYHAPTGRVAADCPGYLDR